MTGASVSTALETRTAYLFLNPLLVKLAGKWEWDLQAEELFCSDVLPFVSEPGKLPGTYVLIHPDDVPLLKEALEKIGPSIYLTLKFRVITTYGEVRTVKGNGTFSLEQQDDFLRQYVEEKSIQYLRGKEQQYLLGQTENQLKAYQYAEQVNNSGIWYINAFTHETFYSDQVFRIYGLPPQSLNPHLHTFMPFIHPEDKEIVTDAFDKAYKEQLPLHLEYRIETDNHQVVKHVRVSTSWTTNQTGEPVFTGMLEDITAQKQQELLAQHLDDRLQTREQMQYHAEQMTLSASWSVNLLTRKFEFSPSMYRIYGLKHQSIPLSFNFLQDYVHADDFAEVALLQERIFREHKVDEFEYRIVRADGKVRHLRMKGKLLINQFLEMMIIGTIHDITEQVNLSRKGMRISVDLQKAQQAFSQAEQLAEIGTWTIDLQTNEISWSEGFNHLIGMKPGISLSSIRILTDTIYPSDKAIFKEHFENMLAGTHEIIFTFRILRKGIIRTLKALFRQVTIDDRKLFFAILQDKTNELQLEQKIREHTSFEELLMDSFKDRIIVTDINNNIIKWNFRCEEVYNIKKDKAIGQNLFDIFPELKNPKQLGIFQQAHKGQPVFLQNEKSSVTEGYHDLMVLPIRDETGKITAVISMLRDVTKEHKLKLELSERLQFIGKILEATVDRIIMLDRNMNYVYWNKRAEEYYDLKMESVLGRNILEIFPGFINDPSYQEFRQALKGETVHITADQNLRNRKGYFETYLVPIKDEKNNVSGILWIVHDLTKEYMLVREQRKANQILDTINEVYFELDQDYLIKYVNRQGQLFWKMDETELLGRMIWDVFPEAEETEGYTMINTAMATRKEARGEYFSTVLKRWMFMVVTPSSEGVIVLFYDIHDTKSAQDQLTESQRFVQKITATSPDAITVFDLEKKQAVYINDTLGSLLGFSMDDLERMGYEGRLRFLVHPDDKEKLLAHNKAMQTAGDDSTWTVEYRLKHRDGSYRDIRNRSKVFQRNNQGIPTHLLSILQDITVQNQAAGALIALNQELETKNQIYSYAEQIAMLGTWTWQPKSNEALYSDNLFRLFGIEPSALKPGIDPVLQFIHPDDRPALLRYSENVKHGKDTGLVDYRVIRSDGEERIFRNKAKLIHIETGDLVIGTTQDITEEIKLQSQLKERTVYAEAIIDASIDRISVFDHDLNIIAWNNRSEETTRLKKDMVIGKKLADVFPKLAEDQEFLKSCKDALKGRFVHLEARKGPYDGAQYENYFLPLKHENGETYAIVNIMHDVSDLVNRNVELKELNKTLEQKNKELEEKNAEITMFAFVASHDLKEPLRKISTFSDWLLHKESGNISQQGKEHLRRLDNAVRRMDRLLQDILVLTKIHNEKHQEEPVNVNSLLLQLRAEMQEKFRDHNVELEVEELPVIQANNNQVYTLLKNLIENAIKFQDGSAHPKIRVTCEHADGRDHVLAHPDREYIRLSVSDNGLGFETRFLKKIFQVFQRLHTQQYGGTGIGLAICKKIMENHKGFITAESEVGKGSTFHCYFPV
jgi:PAS domain S-box-containing protein